MCGHSYWGSTAARPFLPDDRMPAPAALPWFRLLAVACLAFTLATGVRTTSFLQRARRTEGTLLGFERQPHSNRRFARVRYAAVTSGNGVAATEGTFPIPATARVDVGDALPILYDPARPAEGRPDYFLALWGWPLAGLIGAFVAGGAARRLAAGQDDAPAGGAGVVA